jgi:hypothetical protein
MIGGVVRCCSPRTAFATSSGGTVSLRHHSLYPCHNIFYRLGVRGRNDHEIAVAFRTVPKMTYLPLIPILGPFGGNQLIVALKTVCAEA